MEVDDATGGLGNQGTAVWEDADAVCPHPGVSEDDVDTGC